MSDHLLISKIFTVIHALFLKQYISLELKEIAIGIVYIIQISICASDRIRHSGWLAVETFSVNEDDHYSEPSSRSECPWRWIMQTMWKFSRMDWSEQLCKREEIAFTRAVKRRNTGMG